MHNFVLATAQNNNKRGNDDIFKYATEKHTTDYFESMKKCKIGDVQGADYLKGLAKTLRGLWEQSPLMKHKEMWEVLKRY